MNYKAGEINGLKCYKNIFNLSIHGVSRRLCLLTLFFNYISDKYDTNTKRTAISISTNSSSEHSYSMLTNVSLKNLFSCRWQSRTATKRTKIFCTTFILSDNMSWRTFVTTNSCGRNYIFCKYNTKTLYRQNKLC